MPPTVPTNTRATRSRFSSPLQTIGAVGTTDSTGTSAGGGNGSRHGSGGNSHRSNGAAGGSGSGVTNAQKALMARWLEPPVQNKTSFEEAGFQRHGVFEGMAPLGTLPKPSNVAKRMSNLFEEKFFHDSPPHNSRQTAKQQQLQKQRELREQEDQGQEQRRQVDEDDREDWPEEQEEQWVQPQEQEKQKQEENDEAERQRKQQQGGTHPKKIIIKRPSTGTPPAARTTVGLRRPTLEDVDVVGDESDADVNEGPTVLVDSDADNHSTATGVAHDSPGHRRSIIIGPAPSGSGRQASAATKRQKLPHHWDHVVNESEDDAGHDNGKVGSRHSSREPTVDSPASAPARQNSKPQKEKPGSQKPAKRPVGRPRSRRSIAAEHRALKAKADAEAEAERLTAAQAAAQIEAEAPVQKDEENRNTGNNSRTTDMASAHHRRMGEDGNVTDHVERAEDTESDVELHNSDDDDASDPEEEHEDDSSAIVLDSSFLPLMSHFDFKRPRSDSNATVVNREVTDRVVEIAVDEALRHFRYPTAWALRTLYDERSGNQNFLAMVEDVFQQTADRETLETFVRMVHEKKKEGKKDNKACYYFVPPSTNSRFTPHHPKPAPYAHLLTFDPPKFAYAGADADAHTSKRVKLMNADNEPGLFTHASGAANTSAAAYSHAPLPTFAEGSSASAPAGEPAVAEAGDRDGDASSALSANGRKDKTHKRVAKTPTQSPKTTKTPTRAPEPPKTPSKTNRTHSRTPGTKTRSVSGKTGSTRGKMSAGKADGDSTTTPSSRRRLRNRTGSLASSTSSLSSAMSLSPPSKALRDRGGYETVDAEVDGEDDNVVLHDGVNNTETGVSGNANALKRMAEVGDGGQEREKENGSVNGNDVDAPQPSIKRRGVVDRRRGGPGTGRGGRRRGAGRPPKNRSAAALAAASKATAKTIAPPPAPTPTPAPGASLQPIATRNKSSAKKSPTPLSALISPLSSSSSQINQTHTTDAQNNNHHQRRRHSTAVAAAAITASAKEMPAAVEDPISVRPVSVSKRAAQHGSSKSRSSTALPSPALNSSDAPATSFGMLGQDENEDERRSRLRRESRNITNSIGVIPESFTRHSNNDKADQVSGDASSSSAAAASRSRRGSVSDTANHQQLLQTPQPQRQRQLRASTTTARTTRSARKRAFDEVDDDLSPTSGSFPSEEPPSARLQTPVLVQQTATANASNLNSRAGTPGPRSKKPRVGLRVKTSPVKRKTGTSAGVPRASGERASPVANGIPNNQDDNDDYCTSCGGSGELVCCDGCTRSFHFKCVDPPLQEGGNLPDEWFCNVCVAKRNPASLVRHTGVFGALMNAMEKKNSSAFRLPSETRDYFEGVKTGLDGEYEDVIVPGPQRARKRGYEEAPDFFRIRDADGNSVLCHSCNRSAEDNRPIIPCAFCGLWWHIDCLDPPMANPPVLRNWRCPAHTDDILAKLPGLLGPAHRFRKIKGAPIIKPVYSRGMVNNGFIEFHSDEDSDNNSGWKDLMSFGRVQRISARGVELDFLEQIRQEQRKGRQRHARINGQQERVAFRSDANAVFNAAQAARTNSSFLSDRHYIDEAQAAHNLSALGVNAGQGPDRSGELINVLLSQADTVVVSMMAQGSALNIENGSALTQEDRVALQAMRARIDHLLGNSAACVTSSDQFQTEQVEAIGKESADVRENGNPPGTTSGQLPQFEPEIAPKAEKQQAPENLEVATAQVHEVPDIIMQDAPAREEEHARTGAGDGGGEAVEKGTLASHLDQALLETNEVMSLVSDNGESDLNEDEDPPPIATPLHAPNEEPTSAVWPIEHISSGSEPGSGNGGLPPSAKVNLAASDINSFHLCGHGQEVVSKGGEENRQIEGQHVVDVATVLPPSPLTPPPASSEVGVEEDDKENETSAGRLDKESEQHNSHHGACGKPAATSLATVAEDGTLADNTASNEKASDSTASS